MRSNFGGIMMFRSVLRRSGISVLLAVVVALLAMTVFAACGGGKSSDKQAASAKPTPPLAATGAYEVMGLPTAVPNEPPLVAPSEVPEELRAIWEAWAILNKDYFDRSRLDPSALTDAAIRGMLSALKDPHTSYINPEAFALENTDYLGEFEGIGAEVSLRRDGKLVIVSPIPGSPAEAAGLRPGDIVLEVNGVSLEGLSLLEAVAKVRGPRGTIVRLLVKHLTDIDPVLVAVERGRIPLVSVIVRSEAGDRIAHIRLTNYFPNTADLLSEAIKKAVDGGAEGLIIDVRDNLGGLLTSVVDVASQFLDDGLVVYEVDGQGRRKNWGVKQGGVATEIPMVVLINNFSASASEVLVGALQDHKRAQAIGTHTFGKAAVNLFRALSNGGGLYVTTAQWYTPLGRLIHEVGLMPDIEVTAADPRDADVKQLEKAREVLESLIATKKSAGAR